ncbi:hypothetical protein B0A50_00343 [Salinomyces thailandicus]|uniref:Uncharacterized protein n=1 Tax=Salinomyces thailandicus TaxID=706561 RepID=A0A4U0UFM0_9PEZI|nr:hypothetical protein B0A50_00343 [Salinomyces thailandica]
MNYCNMIEEKHLKKGFIVATIISTIVGTFTASMTLHEKIQDRRAKKKQKALDARQTGAIDELKERLDKLKGGEDVVSEHSRSRSRSRSRSHSRSRSRRRRRRRPSYDQDDFTYESRRSRAMIERMYEDHLHHAGSRYAVGDMATENRLQAQIIQLQQTVISVLQDALYNGRGLTETDQRRLIAAQSAARDSSLDALEDHYRRVNSTAKRKPLPTCGNHSSQPLLLEPAPLRANFSRPQKPQPQFTPYSLIPQTLPPRTRSPSPTPTLPSSSSFSSPETTPTLFCPYSTTLQTTNEPLSATFHPTDPCLSTCPHCRKRLDVSQTDFWFLTLTSPCPSTTTTAAAAAATATERGTRQHRVDARFIVQCHTTAGKFAL